MVFRFKNFMLLLQICCHADGNDYHASASSSVFLLPAFFFTRDLRTGFFAASFFTAEGSFSNSLITSCKNLIIRLRCVLSVTLHLSLSALLCAILNLSPVKAVV